MTMHCCQTCGFLGLRNKHTGQLDEAIPEYRNESRFKDEKYSGEPLCGRNKVNLPKESEEHSRAHGGGASPSNPGAIQHVLKKERAECASLWTEWIPGFTPKEHMEMVLQQALLDIQYRREEAERKWRTRQAKRQHAWRKELDKRDREWRKEDMQRQHEWRQEDTNRTRESDLDNSKWRRWELLVMGGVVTVVSIIGQIVAAFVERGSLFGEPPKAPPPPTIIFAPQMPAPATALPPTITPPQSLPQTTAPAAEPTVAAGTPIVAPPKAEVTAQ